MGKAHKGKRYDPPPVRPLPSVARDRLFAAITASPFPPPVTRAVYNLFLDARRPGTVPGDPHPWRWDPDTAITYGERCITAARDSGGDLLTIAAGALTIWAARQEQERAGDREREQDRAGRERDNAPGGTDHARGSP